MNAKLVFTFGIGFISGGVSIGIASVLYFKEKYRKKYENDLKEMEDYYNRTDEYLKEENDSSKEERKEETDNYISLEEAKNRIKEPRGNIDYTSFYQAGSDPVKFEHPEEENEEEAEYKAFHKKYDSKPPKIISEEVFGELPIFIDHKVMFYYPGNNVLTDEDDLIEDNPELLLGDCLTKYGFDKDDEELIYVLNYEYDTVYEIQKLKGAFYE